MEMIEYVEVGQSDSTVTHRNMKYIEARYNWILVRDFVKGDSAVKRKNETYLPMPAGFILKDDVSLGVNHNNTGNDLRFDPIHDLLDFYDDPNFHHNRPYSLYKHGAKSPAILKHTINGLMGLIIKKPMVFVTDVDDFYDPKVTGAVDTKSVKDTKVTGSN